MSETPKDPTDRRSDGPEPALVEIRQRPPYRGGEPIVAISGHQGTVLKLSYAGSLQEIHDLLIAGGAAISMLLEGRPQG